MSLEMGIQHIKGTFFLVHDDLLDLGNRRCPTRGHTFGAVLRALEMLRKRRITTLKESGVSEDCIDEESLWFHATYATISQATHGFVGERTVRSILPEIIGASFAQQRFAVRDNEGKLWIYATYEEARKKWYSWQIIQQVYFDLSAVNAAIAQMPIEEPPKTKGDAQRGVANLTERSPDKSMREGNSTEKMSASTIPDSWQFCQLSTKETEGASSGNFASYPTQGSTIGNNADSQQAKLPIPAGNFARNKDLIDQNLIDKDLISAPGAVDLSRFFETFDFSDWSEQAILALAARILPPLQEQYKQPGQREKNEQKILEAASTLYLDNYLQERGLRHLARLFCYAVQPGSGCTWRARQSPKAPVRLWGIAAPFVARLMSNEMEKNEQKKKWSWPKGLEDVQREESPSLDLAKLEGIPEEERVGIPDHYLQGWLDCLADVFAPESGVYVSVLPLGGHLSPRGNAIEIREGDEILRFYERWHWDLIVEALEAGAVGSQPFLERLEAGLKQHQAAEEIA